MASDTGTSNKDGITADGTLKLAGIKTGHTVQFQIAAGSESLADGSEWLSIPADALAIANKAGTVELDALYNFLRTANGLGDTFKPDADGWKDTLNFRAVDASGTPAKSIASLTLSYDNQTPAITHVDIPTTNIKSDQTGTVRLLSTEKLVGVGATDFTLSNTQASIIGVTENKTAEGGWAYNIDIKGARFGAGTVELDFAKNAIITDIAGNSLDTASNTTLGLLEIDSAYSISVGMKTPSKVDNSSTNDGNISFENINKGSHIEFQLRAGSESFPNGSKWLSIDTLNIENRIGKTTLEELYSIIRDAYDLDETFQPDADGWKDNFNFRDVSANGQSIATVRVNITYDKQAPEISKIILPDDAILNGNTGIVRFLSTEKLLGLDAKDFILSNPKLASISGVTETKILDSGWAYDIAIKNTQQNSDELNISFASTASVTDIAGNALIISNPLLGTVDIGAGNVLTVNMASDTGTSNKDGITADGTLKLAGIKTGHTVQFQIAAGSESLTDGSEWLSIPADALAIANKAGTVELDALYNFLRTANGLGDTFKPDADGWKDTLNFRAVDAGGTPAKSIASLTLSYDNQTPAITHVDIPTTTIKSDQTGTVRLLSTEKLVGVGATDFTLSNTPASIIGVTENKTAEGGWAYNIDIKCEKFRAGTVELDFAKNAIITDIAGNSLDTASNTTLGLLEFDSTYSISVGMKTPSKVDNSSTNDGNISFENINKGSHIEFQLRLGSESFPNGSKWLSIDTLNIENRIGRTTLEELYSIIRDAYDLDETFQPDADGWKDNFNFRDVSANGQSIATVRVNITYDKQAPEISKIILPDDAILNGNTGIVRFLSTEKLLGLDAKDFILSNPKLASISGVTETKILDSGWAYDIAIKNTQQNSDELNISFASTASVTDIAGNALIISNPLLGTVDIGAGNVLTVNMASDTGTSNKDGITADGTLKLAGIKTGHTVQFQIAAGSESLVDGSKWLSIPADALSIANKAGTVELDALYNILRTTNGLGDTFKPDADGWKDTLNFRSIDAAGTPSKSTASLAFTYDNQTPAITDVELPTTAILNGQTGTIQLLSTEKLVGLDAKDFVLSNALASITGITEIKPLTPDSDWTYAVTLKGATSGNGDVDITLAKNASVTDTAGNNLDITMSTIGTVEIGAGSLLAVSLVNDTGLKNNDGITNDSTLKLDGIKADATVEFRRSNNPSYDDWYSIPEELLKITGKTGITDLTSLVDIIHNETGIWTYNDAFDFRQIDSTGKISNATTLKFTIDKIAPEITSMTPNGLEIANNATGIVHITSTEQLVGLSTGWDDRGGHWDLVLKTTGPTYEWAFNNSSNLAKISSITESEVSLDTGGEWFYDATIKASSEGSGELGLAFHALAGVTDLAGNTLNVANWDIPRVSPNGDGVEWKWEDAPVTMWIGGNNLSVRLLQDTNASYDNLTNNGKLEINGIQQGSTLEFRLKSKSESAPNGTEWLAITEDVVLKDMPPLLSIEAKGSHQSGYVDIGNLYSYLSSFENFEGFEGDPSDGSKDIWEFRQVDSAGNVAKTTASTTISYDNSPPTIFNMYMVNNEEAELNNGKIGTIRIVSTEQLWGLSPDDFVLSDPTLATITNVNNPKAKYSEDDSGWIVDVTIKAAATGEGELAISFADDGDVAQDFAGNYPDLSMWSESPFLLWIV
jgi:hypothetical protein